MGQIMCTWSSLREYMSDISNSEFWVDWHAPKLIWKREKLCSIKLHQEIINALKLCIKLISVELLQYALKMWCVQALGFSMSWVKGEHLMNWKLGNYKIYFEIRNNCTYHRGQLVTSQKGEEGGSIGLGLWPVSAHSLCPKLPFVIFGSM